MKSSLFLDFVDFPPPKYAFLKFPNEAPLEQQFYSLQRVELSLLKNPKFESYFNLAAAALKHHVKLLLPSSLIA